MIFAALSIASLGWVGLPPRIPAFVRIDRPPTPAELAILEEHGVTGFLVRASDQTSLEALRGRPVLVEGVLPDGNLKLPRAELERYFDHYFGVRDPALTTRPSCFRREPVRTGLRQAATTGAAALLPYAPLGLFLVEDPSITSASEPFDWCYCVDCRAGFSERLADRVLREPDLLERAGIGAAASSFEPWTVDRARARNLDRPRRDVNLFPWLAWRRFMDESLASELASLGALARAASGAPTGFLGGAPSSPFGGHDWARLATAADILLPPDDPSSRAVCASFQDERSLLLTSIRSTGGTERVARQKIRDHFLTRSHGILFASLAEIITHDANGPAPTVLLNVAHEAVQQLERDVLARVARSTIAPPRVGILYSPASLDVLWLKDTEPDGVWWPSRAGRLDRELLPLAGTWWGWQLLLEDVGAAFRFVDGAALAAEDGLAGLGTLVLPRAIVLSDAEAAGVRRFVDAGGLLIADAETGLFDELGRGRDRGALDDVFQIDRDDQDLPWDWHWEETRSEEDDVPRVSSLRVREPNTHAGESRTVIDRAYGEGRAVYLNLDLSDYVGAREVQSAAAASLCDQVRGWLVGHGVSDRVRVERADGAPGAWVKIWRFIEPDGRELLVLARNETLPEMRGRPEDRTPMEYRLIFDRPVQALNLTEGDASRGAVRELTVALAPARWVLFGIR